jgi:phosphatidylserine/phosphatidylglycerophosphate/cardiolipin synthase-like enzyme
MRQLPSRFLLSILALSASACSGNAVGTSNGGTSTTTLVDSGIVDDTASSSPDASTGADTPVSAADTASPVTDTHATTPPADTGTPADVGSVSSAISLKVQPDDGESWFLTQISGAKTSVHLESYMLTDSTITNALISAKNRGVGVQVILDPSPYGNATANQTAYGSLQTAGVSVQWSRSDVTYTHAKFMLIDGATLDVMTLNQDYSAYVYNREYALVTTNSAAISEASALFAADWAKTAATASLLVVSPINSRTDLTSAINSAKKTLDIEVEEIDDNKIATALTNAVSRGVTVRMILNASEASSETAIIASLQSGGVTVKILNANTTLDAKAMLIDGSSLFVGSENFSTGSLDYNREVGLFTGDSVCISRYQTAFATDLASATAP